MERRGARGRIQGFIDWLRGNRLLAVVLALGLAAVPTGFGIFPHLTDVLSRTDRIWIMVGWTLVAVATAFAAAVDREKAEQRAEESLRLQRKMERDLRPPTEKLALRALLQRVPALYQSTVYIFDEEKGYLFPWYPVSVTDPGDPRVFRPGKGATGLAYSTGSTVAVVGDAVSNADYDLTPAQREFYSHYNVVIAVPATDPQSSRTLGVLTLIATLNDETYVTDDLEVRTGAISELKDLADRIGEILSQDPLP